MTGIEFEQRFFPATNGNTHTCRNKRRSCKFTIVISNSESIMSARVQKMLPELKRISRMAEKGRKNSYRPVAKMLFIAFASVRKTFLNAIYL
jgi:hypothetical protein